jgi:triosephosphate isomerase (TIM)
MNSCEEIVGQFLFYFIINAKNYAEASGQNLRRLGAATQRVTNQLKKSKRDVRVVLSVPAFAVFEISREFPSVPIYAQHLDRAHEGNSTGFLVPEIAKAFGAKGSLLNHSEHRILEDQIQEIVARMKELEIKSVVCARNDQEVKSYCKFSPDFVAIEPPELIGSGNAVSRARPELVSASRKAIDSPEVIEPKPVLLCGAGIVDTLDVEKAVELGAQGVLVASAVIKATNWQSKISSLARGFPS